MFGVTVESWSGAVERYLRGLAGRGEGDQRQPAALVAERDRLVTECDRLMTERSRFAAERDAALAERAGLAAERDRLVTECDRLVMARGRLAAERDAALAERAGLVAERDQLAAELMYLHHGELAERDRLVAARDGLEVFLRDESIEEERRLVICERAVADGRLAEVTAIFHRLHEDPSHARMAQQELTRLRYVLASGLLQDLGMPDVAACQPATPLGPPFRVLVAGADRILLVFLGAGRRLWRFMSTLHRLLKPFGTHIVYLCDSRIVSYARGIDGLGSSYETALAALRDLCRALAPGRPRIFCFGQSMGGIGALRYGLDLGAEAVLATGGMTSLAANVGDPVPEDEKAVSRRLGADAVDLLPLFRAAAVIPRITLIHAAGMGRDTLHAQRLAGLPGARVVAIPDLDGHDVLPRLIAEHRFEREIALLLGVEPP
jgi:hypothetical protein